MVAGEAVSFRFANFNEICVPGEGGGVLTGSLGGCCFRRACCRPIAFAPCGLAAARERAVVGADTAVAVVRAAGSPAGAGAGHPVAAGAVGAGAGACRRDRGAGLGRARLGGRGGLGGGCRGRGDDGAARSGPIPVGNRIAEAFAYRHGFVPVGEQGGEDVVGQVVDGLVVDVVLNLQEARLRRVGPVDGIVPDVLAGLDHRCVVVEVARCVEVEINDMVSERRQDALAVLLADGIGRAHVGWKETENGVEGNLVPHHLVRILRAGQLAGILVRPGMAGDLVSFGVHPLDRVC